MVTTPNVTIRNINVQADISMHLNRSTCFIILWRVHRLLDIKRNPSFNEGNSVQSTSKYILINADIAGGIHLRPPYSSVCLFASKRRHSVCRNKFKEKSCTPITESVRLKNAACSPGMQKACMQENSGRVGYFCPRLRHSQKLWINSKMESRLWRLSELP